MDKLSFINILKAANPFKYLDKSEVLLILEYGQFMRFPDAKLILEQGCKGSGLYIVVEGHMNVTIRILGQGTIHLATLFPGNFFGEISFLENQLCTATINSKGESLCFLFKKETFECLYLAFPKIRHRISQALIEEVILRQALMIKVINRYAKHFLQHKIVLDLYPKDKNGSIIKEASKDEIRAFVERFNLDDFLLINPSPYIINKIECPNNHILIQEKQSNQSCFYILRGAIQVGVMTTAGFLKFAVIGPQKLICNTSSLLNKEEGLFIYKTIGITTVLEISSWNIEQLKETHPLIWYHFYDILVGHVISLQKKLNAQILLIESAETEEYHV